VLDALEMASGWLPDKRASTKPRALQYASCAFFAALNARLVSRVWEDGPEQYEGGTVPTDAEPNREEAPQ
jgi:hypothetical protein